MAMIRPETEMKDSGIQWIGDIPNNWNIKPLYACLDEINQKNNPIVTTNILSLTNTDGVIPYSERGNQGNKSKENFEEYKVVYPNTIVANSMNILIGSVGLSKYEGCVSPVYYVYMAKPQVDIRYMNYLFQMEPFQKRLRQFANGILEIRLRVSSHDILHQKEAVPDYDEQQAIADYLDETCSKIDEIIAEAKASIDEYKELKQAVIFDGISLGTRKCCDYKRTTLKGIEKIPIEWEYRKLKFLIRYIESGVSVNAGNEPATELEYGVLKTSCVSKMIFLPSENKSVNKDEYDRVKCPVCGDTIIVSRMNTPDLVGACAYIEKNIDNIFLPDRLWQVHFNDNVNVKYIYYCLISPYIRNYYSSLSTGTSSSMQNISQGQFTNAIIPYPPLEEQKEIVDFLDKRTKEIDSLIAEKESLINDLEAYKKSLIYEVVTGKRRVV